MEIDCKFCKSHFVLQDTSVPIQFCPSCAHSIYASEVSFAKRETIIENQTVSQEEISLVQGHAPETKVHFSIGPYQILKSIGKGGMGEVFLAYDTTCGRRIALKRIRADLIEHQQMHTRFLKEARVTSQLTHPAIIPIYVIEAEDGLIYYTMPFVEGETLKTILRDSKNLEKAGSVPHPIGGSIPPLVRIFLTICQAVAYAHSKHVLHRDLKPENIIIGKYGEVLILDWGLATLMNQETSDEDEETPLLKSLHHLTRVGKVVGTVAYMAPERAMGMPANIQTDIYSLGVMLYQILTLRSPFKRGTLKEFRENLKNEELYDPIEVAPYRDVPKMLSTVVLKCLSIDPKMRYESVDELIHDIETYLEGRSEWFLIAKLDIDEKTDWEFQENVLIAEHIAITRETEVTEWVSLMISKQSFPENIKIEAEVQILENCSGLGFLLSVPEKAERVHISDGYCLWLGKKGTESTKLLSSTIEVFHAPDVFLVPFKTYKVCIEKIENHLHFYLNDQFQFSYVSHKPLAGTHIGFLSKDANFSLSEITIYSGSESIQVSCLAVPDAFLAHKDFNAALNEYRRLGYSFPGTKEGREALFRAGITLLEQGKSLEDKKAQEKYFEAALQEFGKLHGTAGGPLEYLGKALVYETCQDYEEEIKCFELGFRRYPKHPLLPFLNEQVLYRMYESSRVSRKAAYNFVLLAIRFLPSINHNMNSKKLFASLKKNWEPLEFIEEDLDIKINKEVKIAALEIVLSFWLAKPYAIVETIDYLSKIEPMTGITTIMNGVFCLINLGLTSLAFEKMNELKTKISADLDFQLLELAIQSKEHDLKQIFNTALNLFPTFLTTKESRLLEFLLNEALMRDELSLIEEISIKLKAFEITENDKLRIDYFYIAALLINKKWQLASEVLHSYPETLLHQETTGLHFLYGCLLYMTEGKEIAGIHFSGVLEVPYPRTWTLASHYLNHPLQEDDLWFKRAFTWEKMVLYRELILFYKILGDEAKVAHFKTLEKLLLKH